MKRKIEATGTGGPKKRPKLTHSVASTTTVNNATTASAGVFALPKVPVSGSHASLPSILDARLCTIDSVISDAVRKHLAKAIQEHCPDTCVLKTPFSQTQFTFIMETFFSMYIMPQPSLFVNKNVNYFKSYLRIAFLNFFICKWFPDEASSQREDEYTYYDRFCSDEFKGGKIKTISSGKKSYMRNRILGQISTGARLTITIDSTLGPNYIAIPRTIYNALNLTSNWVVINRAPSMNSRCIYVCEVLIYDDPNDFTIHTNAFVCPFLNADQDGDEFPVHCVLLFTFLPRFDMSAAHIELSNLSWKYGNRHDILYSARYAFSQYHRLILHLNDEWFQSMCPLWKELNSYPTAQRCQVMMDLGCTLLRDELDDFLDVLLQFTRICSINLSIKDVVFPYNSDIHQIAMSKSINPMHNIPSGSTKQMGAGSSTRTSANLLQSIVASGAKGTSTHIKILLQNLHCHLYDSIDRHHKFANTVLHNFNKYVNAHIAMGNEGTKQFIFLYGLNSLHLHRSYMFINNVVLLSNIVTSVLFSSIYYQPTTVNYVFDKFLQLAF